MRLYLSSKNALDWLQPLSQRDPPHLTDKVIGLINTAGGTQGLQAVNTMEFIVRALRGWEVVRAARQFANLGYCDYSL